jgi:methionyl-tRNA synthetase
MSKRILVTSALPYANGPIHLGHLAGAYLPADLYVRYKRLAGEEIIFICGSDEHGVPITIAADKEGVSPQVVVDRYHTMNKKVFGDFGISFDYFGRTSSAIHREVSQEIFLNLHKKGVFKKKREKQFFDLKAGMFLADRYIRGTCPVCGHTEAYGDQCEKCGTSLSPTELINPVSMLSGEPPEMRETEHWYIPLGDFQERISAWLDTRTDWKPNVMGQCRSWLNAGLGDRAVTRDLTWGVPVPLEDAGGKVLYVWFDAPIGYISATKEWAAQTGNPEDWKLFWMDEETDLVHFIGKDNIVFHCIMFPATLMAHGDYILPVNVPANEFLNLEGRKLSTSRGWAVWLHEYLQEFESDHLRYALGTTMPETKDSDFSWKDFQARVNNELADIFGNFIFRTLSFTDKYFEGKVPRLTDPTEEDNALLIEIATTRDHVAGLYNQFRFRDAIAATMNLARSANRYFTSMEPWHTRKSDPAKCGNTLNVCVQVAGALSILFEPVLPAACRKLRKDLGLGEPVTWAMAEPGLIESGRTISAGEILFRKLDDELIDKQIEKLLMTDRETAAKKSIPEYPPISEPVDFGSFAGLDIRAGKILKASPVKGSKKLLDLTVDIGVEMRRIISGIAEFHKAEDVTGRTVCVVANLKPKKIMGIESNGMILMAESADRKLYFVETDAEPGSIVK